MTKLTRQINKDDEHLNDENQQSNSLSLSKKIQKDNVDNTEQKIDETVKMSQTVNGDKKFASSTNISSVEDISEWFISLIGEGVFEQLKTNPYLQLPLTETDITTKDWLVRAIKTIFTQDGIQSISAQIQQNQTKISDLSKNTESADKIKAEIDEKLAKYNQKFQELQNRIDEVESEKFQIQKELNTAVPLTKLISEFYRDPGNETPELKRLMELLNESLDNKGDTVGIFLLRFSKGWFYLKSIFTQLTDDEKTNLEKVHAAGSEFLRYISGVHIPERRPLLDVIAKICSLKFQTYDFISPEQTLTIDPEIHNAQGLGNKMIKEGISFAVVRRETRKAVKYADIRVN